MSLRRANLVRRTCNMSLATKALLTLSSRKHFWMLLHPPISSTQSRCKYVQIMLCTQRQLTPLCVRCTSRPRSRRRSLHFWHVMMVVRPSHTEKWLRSWELVVRITCPSTAWLEEALLRAGPQKRTPLHTNKFLAPTYVVSPRARLSRRSKSKQASKPSKLTRGSRTPSLKSGFSLRRLRDFKPKTNEVRCVGNGHQLHLPPLIKTVQFARTRKKRIPFYRGSERQSSQVSTLLCHLLRP